MKLGNGKKAVVLFGGIYMSLKKEEFRKWFINPLEEHFGYKTYWNGKECEREGLKAIQSRFGGFSYTSREDAPVVIRHVDSISTFAMLIHEYAHSCLHRKGVSGRKLDYCEQEIEAETVVKRVFNDLNLNYTRDWYIQDYIKKYEKKNKRDYSIGKRADKLDSLSGEISGIFVGKKELEVLSKANSSRKTEVYKYMVTCTCCNKETRYKRKVKIIKQNGKGYWCNYCGEKSKDKLKISKL